MTEEKQKAAKPNDPFANVPRVAQPVAEEGERTPEGRLIKRDEYGRAFTESTPQTGGIRTYLDEEQYPPEMPDGEEAPTPPALPVVQAAAAAESQFAPHPPEEQDPRTALQTSTQPTIVPERHAAPAAGVPSFSSTQVTAAEAAKAEAAPAAAQKVIDAVLAHPAAQPKEPK